MFRFQNWYFLFLIPIIIYLFLLKKDKSSLSFSSVKLLKKAGLKETIKHRLGKYLITAALILLSIALARPQLIEDNIRIDQEGIDIALVLDVSSSMLSVDIEPDRLEAARETMDSFIQKRANDRLALVIYAGTAYTRIPLTLDHNLIRESLQDVDINSVNQDGTAIGMGISAALNRLKKSEAESKVIILITDGVNNAGAINPLTAADLARDMGIRVYTIGVGTDETIMAVQIFGQTRYQRYEGGLDEKLLMEIAERTDARYYRAEAAKELADIFTEIDQLEKSVFERDNFQQYTELAFVLIMIALLLLLLGLFLDQYYFIRIP